LLREVAAQATREMASRAERGASSKLFTLRTALLESGLHDTDANVVCDLLGQQIVDASGVTAESIESIMQPLTTSTLPSITGLLEDGPVSSQDCSGHFVFHLEARHANDAGSLTIASVASLEKMGKRPGVAQELKRNRSSQGRSTSNPGDPVRQLQEYATSLRRLGGLLEAFKTCGAAAGTGDPLADGVPSRQISLDTSSLLLLAPPDCTPRSHLALLYEECCRLAGDLGTSSPTNEDGDTLQARGRQRCVLPSPPESDRSDSVSPTPSEPDSPEVVGQGLATPLAAGAGVQNQQHGAAFGSKGLPPPPIGAPPGAQVSGTPSAAATLGGLSPRWSPVLTAPASEAARLLGRALESTESRASQANDRLARVLAPDDRRPATHQVQDLIRLVQCMQECHREVCERSRHLLGSIGVPTQHGQQQGPAPLQGGNYANAPGMALGSPPLGLPGSDGNSTGALSMGGSVSSVPTVPATPPYVQSPGAAGGPPAGTAGPAGNNSPHDRLRWSGHQRLPGPGSGVRVEGPVSAPSVSTSAPVAGGHHGCGALRNTSPPLAPGQRLAGLPGVPGSLPVGRSHIGSSSYAVGSPRRASQSPPGNDHAARLRRRSHDAAVAGAELRSPVRQSSDLHDVLAPGEVAASSPLPSVTSKLFEGALGCGDSPSSPLMRSLSANLPSEPSLVSVRHPMGEGGPASVSPQVPPHDLSPSRSRSVMQATASAPAVQPQVNNHYRGLTPYASGPSLPTAYTGHPPGGDAPCGCGAPILPSPRLEHRGITSASRDDGVRSPPGPPGPHGPQGHGPPHAKALDRTPHSARSSLLVGSPPWSQSGDPRQAVPGSSPTGCPQQPRHGGGGPVPGGPGPYGTPCPGTLPGGPHGGLRLEQASPCRARLIGGPSVPGSHPGGHPGATAVDMGQAPSIPQQGQAPSQSSLSSNPKSNGQPLTGSGGPARGLPGAGYLSKVGPPSSVSGPMCTTGPSAWPSQSASAISGAVPAKSPTKAGQRHR